MLHEEQGKNEVTGAAGEPDGQEEEEEKGWKEGEPAGRGSEGREIKGRSVGAGQHMAGVGKLRAGSRQPQPHPEQGGGEDEVGVLERAKMEAHGYV